jgi:nicotinamidase/pyrazinamidase
MTTALIVVDPQNDFASPNGSLYVKGADELVPELNRLVRVSPVGLAVYTQDWHPEVTKHFADHGGHWPAHCVGGTWGAQFADGLVVPQGAPVIRKGTQPGEDGYSAFTVEIDGERRRTELHDLLQRHNIKNVDIVGIAFDVCVKATALDAIELGYDTAVLKRYTASVNPADDDGVTYELDNAGVYVL